MSIAAGAVVSAYANNNPIEGKRFKDQVFAKVAVQKNISYKSSLPAGEKAKSFLMDVYQPENDANKARPLIIWIHGGGFRFGKKTSRGTPIWSKRFAKRGYVCAAINYRLTNRKSMSDRNNLMNACKDAMEDVNSVVAFFKKEYVRFGIDTTKIILAGNSAGGITALQSVFSSISRMGASEGHAFSPADTVVNPNKIVAVINFWAGMFDSTWLKNTNVPFVSVHGLKDRVVPANRTDRGIFGSVIINRYATELKIPNSVHIYDRLGHELQKHFIPFLAGRPAKKRWNKGGDFAGDFLYKQLFEH